MKLMSDHQAPKEKPKSEMKTSAKERRKKLSRVFNKDMYRKAGKAKWSFYGHGMGERKPLYCDGCKERVYHVKVIKSGCWCDRCISEGKHEEKKEETKKG